MPFHKILKSRTVSHCHFLTCLLSHSGLKPCKHLLRPFLFSGTVWAGKGPAVHTVSAAVGGPGRATDDVGKLRVLTSWLFSLLLYNSLLGFHTNSHSSYFFLLHTPGSCPSDCICSSGFPGFDICVHLFARHSQQRKRVSTGLLFVVKAMFISVPTPSPCLLLT